MGEKTVINQDFQVIDKGNNIYEVWMIATLGDKVYRQFLCAIVDPYRARSFVERLKYHFESIFYIPQWTEVFTSKHMKEVI